MNNQSLLRKLLALMLALPLLMSAQEVTFWNFSDTEMFPSDTLWETTTLHGVTFVTDGSSADRVPIFQSCSSRTWTSADGAEELMFTQRLKINGKSSTAYRWLYFTANPGDTIEVWGNSTSSSSARTLTFKSGGYNGVSWGDVDLATGSNPSYGYVVYGGSEETVMAMVSSGSWYTYAIRLKPNPDFGGGDTPPTPTKRWFFKHGWGDGLDASWEWRELYPNADSTLYIRQDVYGGTGCNYADNALGINSVWVPLSDLTLIDNPAVGDSAEFVFNPVTKAISIRLTKAAPQDEVIVEPDPTKAFSLVGGRVYLDNSLAGWDDECIYLVVGNDSESLCVRFLPDTVGRLTCPVPYVKEDITYAAVIGNSHFTSGAWGPNTITAANHYSAIYSEGWQSGVNDGWEIALGAADNGCPLTLMHLEGEYGERFTTTEKNNCFRLNDDLRQITFIFSTSRTRFVISPLNLKKLYVYGSISNWSQSDADYRMTGFSADGCFYQTLPYSAIERTGNGGQPEFLFKVYHMNGSSYVTQSWPTLAEGCEDYLTFCSNGWKQIVAFNDDDVEDLAQRKATALYIRPLSDFDLSDPMEQERISNFRLCPAPNTCSAPTTPITHRALNMTPSGHVSSGLPTWPPRLVSTATSRCRAIWNRRTAMQPTPWAARLTRPRFPITTAPSSATAVCSTWVARTVTRRPMTMRSTILTRAALPSGFRRLCVSSTMRTILFRSRFIATWEPTAPVSSRAFSPPCAVPRGMTSPSITTARAICRFRSIVIPTSCDMPYTC